MTETALAEKPSAQTSIIVRMADRFGVDPAKLLESLKATAFRGEVSNPQMLALLIVADQYKLNPITREIFAFPDKQNGIVPVVSVDGWARIINEHPAFNGISFADEFGNKAMPPDAAPAWVECTIHRRDRDHATVVREYMAECRRNTSPWTTHPRRMLRHKAMIQCARIAFGFAGIYDADEAERMTGSDDGERIVTGTHETTPGIAAINPSIAPRPAGWDAMADEGARRAAKAHDDAVPLQFTYAHVADLIANGADESFVESAIPHVADPAHRKELRGLLAARKGKPDATETATA
jgi:phage recombination protein Bet